jgi:hypothetical protein
MEKQNSVKNFVLAFPPEKPKKTESYLRGESSGTIMGTN